MLPTLRSVFRSHRVVGLAMFVLIGALLVVTAPNRWGVGIALHYLSRLYWPDRRIWFPETEYATHRAFAC